MKRPSLRYKRYNLLHKPIHRKKDMQNEKIPQKHITKHITLGAHIPYPGNSLDNKTGSWRVMRPIKDPKKCTSCGFCWMFCPDTAITEDFEIKYDYCKGCGICVKACPFGALAMVKEEK